MMEKRIGPEPAAIRRSAVQNQFVRDFDLNSWRAARRA
jgi:hypothetical protein